MNVSRDNYARGTVRCIIDSLDCKQNSIILLIYEHEQWFNLFVERFELVKPLFQLIGKKRMRSIYLRSGEVAGWMQKGTLRVMLWWHLNS